MGWDFLRDTMDLSEEELKCLSRHVPMNSDQDDPDIIFIPGSKMVKFMRREVDALENETVIPEGINALVSNISETITVEDIKWVKERLSLQGRYLCQVIEGTNMVLPSPPVQPRNPELEARCQRLRKEQEEREYRAMTKMVDPRRHREPEESIAYQMKQINRQLIGVAQFLFSVAAGFLFGYLGLELMFGGLDMRVRLLSGIGCALIIAIAEIYFLIIHLSTEDAMLSGEHDSKINNSATEIPQKPPKQTHQGTKMHQD